MGFFSKKRVGSVGVVRFGRVFTWTIPSFSTAASSWDTGDRVLDSACVTAFSGAEFHFHLVVGEHGDIGFYVHYKSTPIPKYSFFFRNNGTGETMRQHTAHTIPKDTERCGHWNVCTVEDVKTLCPDDELQAVFAFDDDQLCEFPGPDHYTFEWIVPMIRERNVEPFTSRSFQMNGIGYALRIDRKDKDRVVVLVFSRSGAVPPHEMAAVVQHSEAPLAAAARTTDMSCQVMTIPLAAVPESAAVVVRLTMYRGGNPFDNFAMNGVAAEAPPAQAAPATGKYGVGVGGDAGL